MMGLKERNLRPTPDDTSLDDLVPKDNFYRRLKERLDLSFARGLVRERYAAVGRLSVEPVVFSRLRLVMFFEGIRSERRLMEIAADRLSICWYLGYGSTRVPARPLQPDPHPRATRVGGLPGLLRADRADVLRGGVGSGPRAVLRRQQGRSQCLAGLYEVALTVSIPVPARPP